MPLTTDALLAQWRMRVHRMQLAHYDMSTYLDRLNFIFGGPVIALSTIVGTTIFATLEQSANKSLQLAVGLLSVAAAVLASLQTFLRFAERATQHRIAGARYASLKAELEARLVLGPLSGESFVHFVDAYRIRLAQVHEESPAVPDRIYRRATAKLRAIETTGEFSDQDVY
jgi:type III secretory pathway component EscS